MSDEDGYWRFCEVVERTKIPRPAVTTPPETEKVVLEQHTATGAYRFRSLEAVMSEASEESQS
ncbi:MAG: hypothetical protein ACOCR0_00465 [Haloferacaceae archaeon]